MTRRVRAASHDTVRESNGAAAAARQLASDILSRWQSGEEVDARAALQGHPELREYRSVALNLVYEDYCRRLERGEQVDPEKFAAEFPEWRTAIRRQIEVHSCLAQFADLSGPEAPPAWPSPGDRFLGFDLQEELGRGAIARVYLAREWAVGNRLVAVKISPSGNDEASILGRLEHPNIVPILSVGDERESGLSAVCMPYRGRTTFLDLVDAVFARGNQPRYARELNDAFERTSQGDVVPRAAIPGCRRGLYVDAVLRLIVQIAGALAYTHAREMLHRDLKPSNILLSNSGLPMLLDFNLSADKRKTTSRIGGTLPYMSPEQIRQAMFYPPPGVDGEEEVDGRADIFALGIIAYELLTGVQPFAEFATAPFSADSARKLLDLQKNGVTPVARMNPQVDGRVSDLISACMAFEVAARPASAATLAKAIQELLGCRYRTKRWFRFHPVRSVAFLAALSVGAIGTAAWHFSRPTDYDRGVQAYAEGEYASAVDFFRRVVDEHPESPIAWFALARAQMKNGSLAADVRESLTHAHEPTDDPRLLAVVAYCEAKHVNPTVTRHELGVAIQQGDVDPITHYNHAVACRADTYAHALGIKACDAAIEADEVFMEAYNLRGYFRFGIAVNDQSGRIDRQETLALALDDLRRAADAVRGNAWYQLAVAFAAVQLVGDEPSMRQVVDDYLRRAVERGIPCSAFQGDVLMERCVGKEKFRSYVEKADQTGAPPEPFKFLEPRLLRCDLPQDYEAEWYRVTSWTQRRHR